MMSFLARAMQNPTFLQQLVQQKEKRKELEEVMNKKRRPIDRGPSSVGGDESSRTGEGLKPIKPEPLEFAVSELEAQALEMLGLGRERKEQDKEKEDLEPLESRDRELDEGFWEELFSEALEEELSIVGDEGE